MRAQCVSRRLRAVWHAKLVEEQLLVSCVHRYRRAGGASCRLEGTLPMAWQQRAGHLRWDAELPAAPRCQRCSSPFTQAHAAVEKCKAVARESLMKVSRCPLV